MAGVIMSMVVSAAMLAAGGGSAGASPNHEPQPGFGQFRVLAGGHEDFGSGCGWVASDGPTHTFTGETDVQAVVIQARSDDDVTLVVETPDGEIHCDDDSLGNGNAELAFRDEGADGVGSQNVIDAGSGTYKVWVGTYSRDDGTLPATLTIFEAPSEFPDSRRTDILLQDGFARGHVDLAAGGQYGVSMLAPEEPGTCWGFIARDSSYALRYAAVPGARDLRFDVWSGTVDTTLVIRTPSGKWLCNDDHADLYPSVLVGNPESGTYHVWVGTHEFDDADEHARLIFRSVAAAAQGPSMDSGGSGFIVSAAGHVLTNHHVVFGCDELSIRRPGHAEARAELIAWNESSDLALLRIASNGAFSPARFRSNLPPGTGEEVATFGYPGEFRHGSTFTTGVVTSLSGFGGHLGEFQFNAEIDAGSSGSPILDRSGNVIGIATSSLSVGSGDEEPVNVNYGIRGFIAQVFLKMHNVSFAQERSGTELSWVEIAEDAQSHILEVGCYN